MKEKFMHFMQGRYGADQFGQFMSFVSLVLLIISLFSGKGICYTLALALIVYYYYRFFSRNIQKRYAENQKYLALTQQARYKFNKKKSELAQQKTHHIYRCPSCKQKIRVPRGRGKIEIRCPKCSTTFVKKS